MFRLTSFPAGDGDCLLLSYGKPEAPNHVLIDGGRGKTYALLRKQLAAIKDAGGKIELLVLSHIDADHIEGLIKLAEDKNPPVVIDEVWFNGFEQMTKLEAMGFAQGDIFSIALGKCRWSWNERFPDGMVSIEDNGAPRSVTLAGGLKLTILSPNRPKLQILRAQWQKWRDGEEKKDAKKKPEALPAGIEALGRSPMPKVLDVDALASEDEDPDDKAPNGSSIAFVAEWEAKRVLFAADAHPDLMTQMISPLAAAAPDGRYPIDLFKVSHHGSIRNTTRDLVQLLGCSRFLISTNGKIHGHPDPQAIAKLIKYAPNTAKTFYFNYSQDRTTPWDKPSLKAKHNYVCEFPPKALTIDI